MDNLKSVLDGRMNHRALYPYPVVDKEDQFYKAAKKSWSLLKRYDLNSLLCEDQYLQYAIDDVGGWHHFCSMRKMKDKYIYYAFLCAYINACYMDLSSLPSAVLLGSMFYCRPNYEKVFTPHYWRVDYVGDFEKCDVLFKETGFYEQKMAHMSCIEEKSTPKRKGLF